MMIIFGCIFEERYINLRSQSKIIKSKRVFVDLNDLSEGGNYSKGVQIGVRRPFIVFDEISFSGRIFNASTFFFLLKYSKIFMKTFMRFFRIRCPCCRKRSCTRRCTRSRPPRWQSCFPKRPFAQPFRDIDSKVWGEEECGPKWLSKRKAAVLAVPLASCECRPSLGGSSSQLRKSPQRSELHYRYLLILRESLQRHRLRRCSRSSSLRKSHRAQTNENELPLELFIIREDLAARFLWGETIELERSAEPQWYLL